MDKIKLISYIVTGIGLFGMAISSKIGEGLFNIQLSYLLLPSLTLTVAGIIILIITSKTFGSSKKIKNKGKEVPIYKDKEIIGYRVVE